MKRNNKKGFTIVELVIVIAVIAILAGVLIPTFAGVIDDANKSADLQEARNAYTEYLIDHPEHEVDYVQSGSKYYDVNNGFNVVTSVTACDSVLTVDGAYDAGDACADPAGANHDGKCDVCGAAVECEIDNCTTHPAE